MASNPSRRSAESRQEDDSAEPVSLGMLESLIGYHLRRASGMFRVDFARIMEGLGIRQALVGVLSVIAANPGVNQGAVGRTLGIKRANMVALINELIGRNLVERKTSTSDRRAFKLTVTAAGRDMLADCRRRIEQHETRLLDSFSEGERQILLELLRRIEGRIEGRM